MTGPGAPVLNHVEMGLRTQRGPSLKLQSMEARNALDHRLIPGTATPMNAHLQVISFCGLIYDALHYFFSLLVNCTWSDWTWSDCSKSCDNGTQNGTRTIDQAAMHGGIECTGPSEKMQSCNTQMCHWATGDF